MISRPGSLILSADAIVRQTEGNFTHARRFERSDAFDVALFSDRICPKCRSRVADAIRTLPRPTLGEHNGMVLRDDLGYSADRIASLESAARAIAMSG